MRKLLVEGCQYKTVHQDLLTDLLRLSTSTYSQVGWSQILKCSGYINCPVLYSSYSCQMYHFACHQVRSKAQSVLFTALGTYNFCCRDITPRVLELLEPTQTNVTQQQFKVQMNFFPCFCPQ